MTVTPVRQELVGLEALVEWLDETPIKYEIIDGSIVVSPPPTSRHEDNSGRLYAQLLAACPPHLLCQLRYGWGYDSLRPRSYLEPDMAVAERAGFDMDSDLHDQVPLLVVETRSPSTWRLDEGVKKDLYAEGGVASYWLLDPRTPRLRILELRDGEYVETAVLDGPGELAVERPYPVTLRLG